MPDAEKPAAPRRARGKFAHAKSTNTLAQANVAVAQAYQRFAAGNSSRTDFEIIMADLANLIGFYRRPNYSEWMVVNKTPHGFELHSALCNARAEVLQHIMTQVALTDDDLLALERAAQEEHRKADYWRGRLVA